MRIGVIGAGKVGSTLGERWRAGGHEVIYGVRNPGDARYRSLQQYATVTDSKLAAKASDIVVLATPWSSTREAAMGLAAAVEGKIVIDCTNPLKPDLSGLTIGQHFSGAEQIAQWLPGAKVVKAFNSTGFNIMADPVLEGRKTVMFVASDDARARQTVAELAWELDFDVVEAGDLSSARILEPFALVWISMAYRFGYGRDFGFSIVRR